MYQYQLATEFKDLEEFEGSYLDYVQQHRTSLTSRSNTRLMAHEAGDTTATTVGLEDLSPLEQDLLEEYERLADNMKKVSCHISLRLQW